MRVLLIQPRPTGGLGFRSVICTEPLGLEIVAASLKGHEVKLMDLLTGSLPSAEVQEFRPAAAGISCNFTIDTYKTIEIARALKQLDKEIFVFLGGHHASLNYSDFFDPAIDAIVVNEGETTAPELINALEGSEDLTKIPGLILNLPEGQFFTGERQLLSSLDDVPFPDRALTGDLRNRYYLGLRKPLITVETARGCPHHCNFCSVWRFYKKRFRSQSAERVVEELARLPAGDVLFTDDNFLANVDRAAKIAERIKSLRLPLRRYIFQARSDTIVRHPEVIREWKEVGLDHVFIGFEKIDQEGLEKVNKQNTVENNEKAFKFLQSLKIGVYASFIVDPDFTKTEFAKLKNYIKKLNIAQPYFSVLTPLPGTELFENVRERITSWNYELYDLLHAVLPTKLSTPDFYRELAGLYRAAYFRPYHILHSAGEVILKLLSGRLSRADFKKLWTGARLAGNPEAYLAEGQA
ncbi:MAG: B12-binding domain-containing radical SAM protein [Desulfotomaculales bacterium]